MERMNYINENKQIRHLEESIRELEKEKKKADLEQIKKWKRSLLLKGKMIKDIDEWNSLVEERNDLLEENKTLKEEVKKWKMVADENGTHYDMLEEENKKLKEELKKDDREVQVDVDKELLKANDYLIKENKKLNEKVRFLEECLDSKEKLNEGYRKELEKLKSTYVYDAKQVRDIC